MYALSEVVAYLRYSAIQAYTPVTTQRRVHMPDSTQMIRWSAVKDRSTYVSSASTIFFVFMRLCYDFYTL